MHNVFCPKLTMKQMIFIISVVDVIMYVVSVSLGGISNSGFLAPTPNSLNTLGAKVRNLLVV